MSRWLLLLMVLVPMATVLVACNGDAVPTPTQAPTATATPVAKRIEEVEGKTWEQAETDSPLVVLDAKLFFTGLGETAFVIGELENAGSEVATAVTVAFKGYGANDALLDSRTGGAAFRYVLPSTQTPYVVQADLREVVRFELVVNSQPAGEVPTNPLQVLSSSMADPRSGSSWIEGEVENTGDATVDATKVIAVLRDAEGAVVEVASWTLADSLGPGEKAGFKFMAYRRGAVSHQVFAEPAE